MTNGQESKPTILVVDDDKSVRDAGEAFFGTLGYRVETAGAVKTTMDIVYKHLNDYMVGVLDWKLIGATGLDLLKRFRAIAAHRLATYIITGAADQEFRRIELEASRAGAFETYHKDPDLWGKLQIKADPVTNPVLNLLRTSTEDDLTGLWNRRVFEEKFLLERPGSRGRRLGAKRSVLFMDVDDFKERINEPFGHPMGDEVLRRVGAVLRASARIRSGDQAGRWGGDEFLLLLSDADEAQAAMVAQHITTSMLEVEICHEGTNKVVKPTLSIGIGVMGEEEIERYLDPNQELLNRADKALAEAKALKGVGR